MAAYRFAVTFRLEPDGVAATPDTFETTVRKPAAEPGEDGWLFFRDTLWHGSISDPGPFDDWLSERLGVAVESAEFRAFECTNEELSALKAAIAEHPDEFRTASAEEAVHDYFGSSLEVAENT